MFRRLRTVPMNFSAVLGQAPEDHRLALHRVEAPLALGHRLIQATGLHLMTYGRARADDDRAQTLSLTIEGRQVPAIKRKLERMLRLHQPLPFRHVAVYVGGSEIEDTDYEDEHYVKASPDEAPPEPDDTDLRAEIARIRPKLSAAIAASPDQRTTIMTGLQQLVARMKAGDLDGARDEIVALRAIIPPDG
jgi:hypothetical protein